MTAGEAMNAAAAGFLSGAFRPIKAKDLAMDDLVFLDPSAPWASDASAVMARPAHLMDKQGPHLVVRTAHLFPEIAIVIVTSDGLQCEMTTSRNQIFLVKDGGHGDPAR